jgi:hypothetical protein
MCSGGSGIAIEAQWELQRRYSERTAIAIEKYSVAAIAQANWACTIGRFTLVLVLSSIAQVLTTIFRK